MATNTVLSISNLRKDRLQNQTAIYGLFIPRLEINQGDKLLVVGDSGVGKSTLLDMLGLILKPDAVQQFTFSPSKMSSSQAYETPDITHDIQEAWQAQRSEAIASWRRSIGYILQTGALLPFFTVRENALLQAELLKKVLRPEFVEEVLASLKITHLLNKYPAQLSVGERQRVAIARAVIPLPSLILADEPTAALDPNNAENVMQLLTSLVDKYNIALVLVSHAPKHLHDTNFRCLRIGIEKLPNAPEQYVAAVLREKGGQCAG